MAITSFGLYLGNTSACLARFKDDNVDVVANHAGDRVTAAIITLNNTETVTGAAAKIGLFRNGLVTIVNNKRLMNTSISSEEQTNAIKNSTVKIVNETGNLLYSIKINDKIEKFSPKQIASLLLRAMYDISISADHDGEEHNVVFCVPHRFNDKSINGWSDSAFKAGFKVLQMISEPVAASLAHGLGTDKKSNELVLVYRIGGVSSDISLINVVGGSFNVLADEYYNDLGGHKLTDLLASYLGEEFKNKYKIDPMESKRSFSKLKNEAEKCKHILSTISTAHCFVESLCDGIDFSYNITRARFENLIASHIQDYTQPIINILNKTSKTVIDIKKIIVCGGTMKIPKLQEQIGLIFPKGEILTSRWSPDETMAIGAAMHSAHLINYGMYDRTLCSISEKLQCLANSLCIKINTISTIKIPEKTIIPIKIQSIIEIPTISSKKLLFDIHEVGNNDDNILRKIGMISFIVNETGKLKIDTDLSETYLNIHITPIESGKRSSFRFPIEGNDT